MVIPGFEYEGQGKPVRMRAKVMQCPGVGLLCVCVMLCVAGRAGGGMENALLLLYLCVGQEAGGNRSKAGPCWWLTMACCPALACVVCLCGGVCVVMLCMSLEMSGAAGIEQTRGQVRRCRAPSSCLLLRRQGQQRVGHHNKQARVGGRLMCS